MTDSIAILDFGSQYTQLIARRVRELQVYCELFPWDADFAQVQMLNPKGFILSGGPSSVYEPEAPVIPSYVLDSGIPILGICYGMQALTHALKGLVAPSSDREYGMAQVEVLSENPLLPSGQHQVWMSHGDRIIEPPPGFTVLARSVHSPVAAIGDNSRRWYGVQFHPEVRHTSDGLAFISRFVIGICGVRPDWTTESMINRALEQIRHQVGSQRVLVAVSGGVDSSVAAALVHLAVGGQLSAVFVDNGLLRTGERDQVETAFRSNLGTQLVIVDAAEKFLAALNGISEPEEKRRIIGAMFIRVFEEQANKLGNPPFLVQGTIYPDVVESSAPERSKAQRIKTHHNVGGLPPDLKFGLVEPLRYMFKDEVRVVGEALGLPPQLVWRQPFPGPGLAVRCLGMITPQRLECLRAADAIFMDELIQGGLLPTTKRKGDEIAQAFAVLLPVRSVGVMGDQRTYQEVVALRSVTSEDFMTADWSRLPYDLLAQVANRIVNEVQGVNRVVYDITSKPPATIEWE
jgi:GMP synthase (glutamine-hydrolysing)